VESIPLNKIGVFWFVSVATDECLVVGRAFDTGEIAVNDQSLGVEHPNLLPRCAGRDALLAQRRDKRVGKPNGGRSGPEKEDPLGGNSQKMLLASDSPRSSLSGHTPPHQDWPYIGKNEIGKKSTPRPA